MIFDLAKKSVSVRQSIKWPICNGYTLSRVLGRLFQEPFSLFCLEVTLCGWWDVKIQELTNCPLVFVTDVGKCWDVINLLFLYIINKHTGAFCVCFLKFDSAEDYSHALRWRALTATSLTPQREARDVWCHPSLRAITRFSFPVPWLLLHLVLFLLLSDHFSTKGWFSWLFPENSPEYFDKRYLVRGVVCVFCMALVEHLGDGRWYVQLAAIWHWYLPLYISIALFRFWLLVSIHFWYLSFIWYC